MLTELLSEVSETVKSPRARAFLSSALEFVKPYHLALGLRVSRLSTTHVEVVVPAPKKAEDAFQSEIDPGVLTTAANLGAQLLLRRLDQPDLGVFTIQETRLTRLSDLDLQLRGRLEFTKLAQEALRADLQKNGSGEIELVMTFFNESEIRTADCSLTYLCRASDQISWKGTHGSSENPS